MSDIQGINEMLGEIRSKAYANGRKDERNAMLIGLRRFGFQEAAEAIEKGFLSVFTRHESNDATD